MRTNIFFLITLFTTLQVSAQPDPGNTDNTARITELVNQLPADNVNDLDRIISELVLFNEEAIINIAGKLTAPGTGDDTIQRYAISGIVKYAAQNHDPYLRLKVSSALCRALEQSADIEVKDFLMQELQYIAGNEAVLFVAPYLESGRLADPAARVLINIGTAEADGALLYYLSRAGFPANLSIVQAIGEREYIPAAPDLRNLAESDNIALQTVTLRVLAVTGDPESAMLLTQAASGAGYDYDKTNATSSWLLLIENLTGNGNGHLAQRMIKQAIDSGKVPDHTMSMMLAILIGNVNP